MVSKTRYWPSQSSVRIRRISDCRNSNILIISSSRIFKVRANIRELYIHEINKNLDPEDLDMMKTACKVRGIKHNLGPIAADLLTK